ncbi:MAG: 50S ribosomal protein L15 [Gemmataceae bacterium]
MDLNSVSAGVQKRKLKKRVGRGVGSGHGKTSSRGHKGQYASAGANLPGALFTGGQTPMHRRLPKRGFTNGRFAKDFAIVNVGDLDIFEAGTTVDLAALKEQRLVVGTFDGIRILGDGELTKKLNVSGHHFTKTAKEKIEALGGTATLIAAPKPPVRNKMKPKTPKPAKA